MRKFSFDTRRLRLPSALQGEREREERENWVARRDVASRLRVIVEELLRRDFSDFDPNAAVASLEAAATLLNTKTTLQRHADGIKTATVEVSAVTGHANPLAPPVLLWSDGDFAHAEMEFGAAYQESADAPWIHRGVIDAVFDHVLGYVQMLAGEAGMTARLQVTHHARAASDVPLRIEAWVERVDGRRKYCAGKLFAPALPSDAAPLLIAEAEGIFVVPPK